MTFELPFRQKLSIASDPVAIEQVSQGILKRLNQSGFSEDDVFAVHLALEEAMVNAHKHGNKLDSSKKITLDYKIDETGFEISICDEGKGFDPKIVPDPRLDENLLRSDGRGLLLIRSYMDLANYNSVGNCISMIRYRNRRDN
jgi:serine/threonine-protein kinase RsbW